MHLRGMSVSTFVTRAGKWKQIWVDNKGGYLDFVGECKDGKMILSREADAPEWREHPSAHGLENTFHARSSSGAGNRRKMAARIGRCCGHSLQQKRLRTENTETGVLSQETSVARVAGRPPVAS